MAAPTSRARRRCWANIRRRFCGSSATTRPRSGRWCRRASPRLRRPHRRRARRGDRWNSFMPPPPRFLYVPANREKFLDKAMGLPADAFILDLEDSVPVPEKGNARAGVKTYAPKIADRRVWVRVNGFETGLAEADLDAVIGVEGIAGIFLPKVETRDD